MLTIAVPTVIQMKMTTDNHEIDGNNGCGSIAIEIGIIITVRMESISALHEVHLHLHLYLYLFPNMLYLDSTQSNLLLTSSHPKSYIIT